MRDTAWSPFAPACDGGATLMSTRWLRGHLLTVTQDEPAIRDYIVTGLRGQRSGFVSGGTVADAQQAAEAAIDDLGDATGAHGSRAAWQVAS